MMQVDLIQASEMMRVVQAAKSRAARGDEVRFAEVHKAAFESGEDTEWFANRVYQQLEEIQADSSVARYAVEIPAEAMHAMQLDPSYMRRVIEMIHRDLEASYRPREVDLYVRVGETLSEYRTQSWSTEAAAQEFTRLSAGAFYKGGRMPARAHHTMISGPGAYGFFRGEMQAQANSAMAARRRATSAAYGAAAYAASAQAFEA